MVTYANPGVYAVKLVVNNKDGKATKTRLSYINVTQPGSGYCYANVSQKNTEHITRVELGNIDNTSGALGYGDYINLSTTLNQGNSYSLKITSAQNTPTMKVGVWIDWNQDQDFDDENEKIILEGAQVFQTDLLVPENATLGTTRMRIRMAEASSIDNPCGTSQMGEVEDYSLEIKGATGCQEPQAYPNPATNGKLSLQVPCAHKHQTVKIDIISLKGEVKKTFSFTSQSSVHFDISSLAKGIYFIKTTLSGQTFIHRISIL